MDEENKHVFQCSDIPKRSFKYFEALRNKKELCDITLLIGSEAISAHRIIITAVIPYFRGILEKDQVSISLPNIGTNTIKCLIEFAYTCEVRIDAENVKNLLAAACFLGMNEVRDACCNFLVDNLAHDNVLNIREFALTLNCDELLKYTDCYVKRNFEEVAQTKDFLRCPSTYLNELIGKDDIKVTKEEKLLEAILRWIKNSPKERRDELPSLMRKVRMPLMEPLYLAKLVEREEIIRSSLLCRDLIDEAKHYVVFPELRKSRCSFVTESRESKKSGKTSESKNQYICKLYGEKTFTAQHFYLAKKTWHTKETCRFFFRGSSVELHKKMYFFHGGNYKEYDPEKNRYRNLNPMPTARSYVTTVALKNQIYVCGGTVGSVPSNVVERLDPEENEWTTMCSMHISCSGSSSVALGEYIFVLGGKGQNYIYDAVQRYDSVMNKWKNMAPLLSKRLRASAATLNGKIYICGGYVASMIVSSTAEMYDPTENKSTFISPMTTARKDHFLLSCHGKVYALGGIDKAKKPVKGNDVYNPENDEWSWEETDNELPVSGAVII